MCDLFPEEKQHAEHGENNIVEKSFVCLLRKNTLFPRDICEGHTRLMSPLVSVMLKYAHRQCKEAGKTNTILRRVISYGYLASSR